MTSPIETLLDRVDFRCVTCNAKMGECSCWEQCWCGGSHLAAHAHHQAEHLSCVCSAPFSHGRVCAGQRNLKKPCRCACHQQETRYARGALLIGRAYDALLESGLHAAAKALRRDGVWPEEEHRGTSAEHAVAAFSSWVEGQAP